MRLATTTNDFMRVCDNYMDRIRCIHAAGFRYIDLGMSSVLKDDPLLLADNWQAAADEIKAYMEENGLRFLQSHAPGFNPASPEEDMDRAVALTKRAIEVCGYLEIPNTVIHCGSYPGLSKEEWFERVRLFFEALIPSLEKHHVYGLHENECSTNMPWYALKTGADMREFSEFVDHPLIHSCWDTGHANIEGPQYGELLAMGDDLMALHVNDNRGEGDEHLLPFMGTMNVDEIMHGLLDIGYKGCLTFEAAMALRPAELWLGDRRPFPRDTRLRYPTAALQQEFEKFYYQVGKYILTTYGVFEP